MPTDAELAGARLSGAEVAVALAVRAIRAEGRQPTVPAVIEATGLSRSKVYDARTTLRRLWPDEYPAGPADTPPEQALSTFLDPPVLESGPPNGNGSRLAGALPALGMAAPVSTDLATTSTRPPAPWRVALQHHATTAGRGRSWDWYADVYSPAWNTVLELVPETKDPTGDLIALTIDYVQRTTAEPADAKLIAMLVRQYGKAALYGLHTALGATDEHDTRAWYRYARVVAARVVADLDQGAPA